MLQVQGVADDDERLADLAKRDLREAEARNQTLNG